MTDDSPDDLGRTSRGPDRPKAVGAPFRLVTLAVGLGVFLLLAWLLLRL